MGAGSFSKDMSNLFESATTLTDDGSVTGAGWAGFSVICIVPCGFLWNAYTSLGYLSKSDQISMALGTTGAIIAVVPVCCTFFVTVFPGIVAAGLGSFGRAVGIW